MTAKEEYLHPHFGNGGLGGGKWVIEGTFPSGRNILHIERKHHEISRGNNIDESLRQTYTFNSSAGNERTRRNRFLSGKNNLPQFLEKDGDSIR